MAAAVCGCGGGVWLLQCMVVEEVDGCCSVWLWRWCVAAAVCGGRWMLQGVVVEVVDGCCSVWLRNQCLDPLEFSSLSKCHSFSTMVCLHLWTV